MPRAAHARMLPKQCVIAQFDRAILERCQAALGIWNNDEERLLELA
jgi:hypothetical protein